MFKIDVNSTQKPQQGLSYQTNHVPLVPKTTKITDEYEISNQVLGLGIVSVAVIFLKFLHISRASSTSLCDIFHDFIIERDF